MHIATNNPICNYKNFESETSGTHKNHSLVHLGGCAEISAITTDHIGVFISILFCHCTIGPPSQWWPGRSYAHLCNPAHLSLVFRQVACATEGTLHHGFASVNTQHSHSPFVDAQQSFTLCRHTQHSHSLFVDTQQSFTLCRRTNVIPFVDTQLSFTLCRRTTVIHSL